jgi:hypothetical protein
MTCTLCSRTRETKGDRIPRGWKRDAQNILCDQCWQSRMMLRAIALPVAEIMDGTWEEFRAALYTAWGETTQAANWMMTELYVRDVRRSDQPKMPPMARQYLYPEARKRFTHLPSQTVAALEQAIQAKYRAARYELIWTCGRSLPTHRYPHPLPLPNQAWSVEVYDERPLVSVRLGDRRWSLRLRGGARYRRQLEAIKQMSDGRATIGQLDLYQQRIDEKPWIMCKMVAWLGRPAKREAEGVLTVRTSVKCPDKPAALLVAVNLKDEVLWQYHADHVVRWSAEHREQLQRWADDSKYEQRPVPAFAARREAAAKKYRDRMNSAVREIAAQLAGYAVRRKFATVRYDDSDTTYCPGFPWFALRERIKTKLDELSIAFDHASAEAMKETQEPLAKGKVK